MGPQEADGFKQSAVGVIMQLEGFDYQLWAAEIVAFLRPAAILKENIVTHTATQWALPNLTACVAWRSCTADFSKKKTCRLFQVNLRTVSSIQGRLLPWWAALERLHAATLGKRIIPAFVCNMHSHIFGFTFLAKWMWNRKCEGTWRGNW